jgi:hypothetical protein
VAKIILSALISDIRNRLDDHVYTKRRGVNYIRAYNPSPNQPWNAAQQFCYTNHAYVVKQWQYLSPTHKMLWNKAASLHPARLLGHQLYTSFNVALADANNSDLSPINYPPLTPSTPESVIGFSAVAVDSASNLLSWASPLTAVDYTQAFFGLDWQYTGRHYIGFALVQTVRSDVGSIAHSHLYGAGVNMHYKLRTIDKFGRRSPFTHVITVVVP